VVAEIQGNRLDPVEAEVTFVNGRVERYDLRKMNGQYHYRAVVQRTVKGNLEVGKQYVLGCRLASLTPWVGDKFSSGTLCLLFLQDDPVVGPYHPMFHLPAVAFSIPCVGNVYPLTSATHLYPNFKGEPQALIEEIVKSSTTKWPGERETLILHPPGA